MRCHKSLYLGVTGAAKASTTGSAIICTFPRRGSKSLLELAGGATEAGVTAVGVTAVGVTKVGVTKPGIAVAGGTEGGATGAASGAGGLATAGAGRWDWDKGNIRLKSAPDAGQATR